MREVTTDRFILTPEDCGNEVAVRLHRRCTGSLCVRVNHDNGIETLLMIVEHDGSGCPVHEPAAEVA